MNPDATKEKNVASGFMPEEDRTSGINPEATKTQYMIQPQRILITQLRRIGDVLMCTPAIRALRKHYPESFIAFLTEKESASLLTENPYLNELIVLDKDKYKNPLYMMKKVGELRKRSFDLIIDFFGNPCSAWICFLSGAEYRLGPDLKGRGILYNLKMPSNSQPKYAAQTRLDSLQILGIEANDMKLDFFISEKSKEFAREFFNKNNVTDEDFLISVSPTARRHFNRWPLERYAQLCDWLVSEYNAKVILVWGPGEKEFAERIRQLTKKDVLISEATPTLQELGAILERCDLHIGNDNGTKHIAVAVGLPTITIYGPHSHISWTFPDEKRQKWIQKEVNCPDCEKVKHRCEKLVCLDEIKVEEVQEKVDKLLKENSNDNRFQKALHFRTNQCPLV
jgi:heptosyltransferase-3